MWTTLMRLAWRNIWRQKRRTLLTLSAIGLGLGSLLFMINLIEGMGRRIFQLGTQSLVGDAQLHAPGYLETGDPERVMHDVAALAERARRHPAVVTAGPRIFYPVLAAMGDRSASLTLLGVDPDVEKAVTNWDRRLIQGTWFTEGKQVLLGAKLAEKLELEAGGKLVLTAADLERGELQSVLVHVVGVVESENTEINRFSVIAPLDLAENLIGAHDVAHELVLKLKVDLEDRAAVEAVVADITPPGLEGVPWQARLAALLQSMALQDRYMTICFGVIFLLAALGIANTMGMSILERVREFGVLQAVGTTPRELGIMVTAEYTCLGLCGALVGLAFGLGVTWLTMHTGIPMTDVELGGMVMNERLTPVLLWSSCLRYTAVFAALVPLTSIFPVRKVLSYDPAVSLRFHG